VTYTIHNHYLRVHWKWVLMGSDKFSARLCSLWRLSGDSVVIYLSIFAFPSVWRLPAFLDLWPPPHLQSPSLHPLTCLLVWLTLLPVSLNDPPHYSWPTHIIQDDLPILGSLVEYAESFLACKMTYSQVLGFEWGQFGGGYNSSANHSYLSKMCINWSYI
jgi:hypothetical protein